MEDLISNRKAHHTDVYSSGGMILRRGQSFRLTLNFNKPVENWQSIVFTAQTGPPDTEASNTKVIFPVSSFWHSGTWGAVIEASPPNSLKIIITTPATAVIGRYELSIQITFNGQPTTQMLGQFIMLFNPWCSDDEVYMADENERQEYVLSESGILYMGNEKNIHGFGWNYGQFEDNILSICLDILDRNTNYLNNPATDCSQRSSAIYVGRVVSAMINSNDDSGVLEGRWDKDVSDGTNPISWSGSVEILQKWKREGYQPVKYGQCWVFAGIMCTVLRCLGIPTRVITNYISAHNTDGNLCIDCFYDTSGKLLDDKTEDSIWNFHVWNESWFIRRDLGSFYDGWQVLDSTPQEDSDGVYRCGPTSVKAIKEGDVNLSYDGPFVFAEVNADRANYVYHSAEKKEKVYSDTKTIGRSISTKAVGSDQRLDITDNYKYPEGSVKEREVFNKALRRLLNRGAVEDEVVEDRDKPGRLEDMIRDRNSRTSAQPRDDGAPKISGKFKLTAPAVAGEDINLVLNVKNLSADHNSVHVKISCSSILYTGRRIHDIFATYKFVTLDPRGEANIPIVIFYSEYESHYANNNLLGVTALCEVDTGEKVLVRKDISLESSSIKIRVLEQAVVHEPLTVEIKFVNPLMYTVKDCILVAEGSGLIDGELMAVVPSMRPKERIRFKMEITPRRSGSRQLIVHFTSKSFSLKGFKRLTVAPW